MDEKINAVCGLGYEKATADAEGWFAKAVYAGDIKKNIYSVQFVPQANVYNWPGAVPVKQRATSQE